MDIRWVNSRLFSREHLDGVNEFMQFVSERFGDSQEIPCPCSKCLNLVNRHKGLVEDHLYFNGMSSTYTRWIHHGEPLPDGTTENVGHLEGHIDFNEDVVMDEDHEDPDDRLPDMLQELYVAEHAVQSGEKSMFAAVLEEIKKELHPGSDHSRFSFVVKLLHIKSFYRISNVAFNAILKLLSSAFPACSIPTSYHEAKKLIRALGLGYVSIHVCPNNSVLFRKELEKEDKCPVCDASRWKDGDRKKEDSSKGVAAFSIDSKAEKDFCFQKNSRGGTVVQIEEETG